MYTFNNNLVGANILIYLGLNEHEQQYSVSLR
jgi:hypothetical protein